MKELLLFLLLAHAATAYASPGRLVYSTTVDGDATSYHLGGRDVVSGAEASFLEPGNSYEIRLTAFNDLGASELSDAVQVGPLHDLAPDAPTLLDVLALSGDALRVDFHTPSLDGGSAIDRYNVEYDTSPTFDNNPRTITTSVVREKQMVVVESPNVQPEVQAVRATVEVVNEVQSVRSTVVGVNEVQVVTTTADDVVAEVQTVTTTAVDTDEEQIIAIMADDVDEIQLVRTHGDDVPEIQEVAVSVERANEVQRLGIVISNINTDGDNINSAACYGVNVGEPCQDVEEALSGSFTVSFDFDECGNGGANYCQEAVSQFVPSAGIISCTPGLVSNPTTGGDHCVSAPVTPGGAASLSASEGAPGTLQKAVNEMIDDNGMPFMTYGSASGMPGKQTAVTVTRTGRIKTKGSCTLDSSGGGGPATCFGEYEILYVIEFDAYHSSGDVPPLTIVNSGVKIDTTSTSYTTTMCPSAYYTEGCVTPTGSAADLNHGNFYDNSASDTAVESVKGSQPSGMVTLDYECESSVTRLGNGFSMSTSASGMEATFDDDSFTDGMLEGQYIRFNSGNGIDVYRKIVTIDDAADQITLETSAPQSTDYTEVEYGKYHSDWDESDSDGSGTGVSSHCLVSRIHTTLPIDLGTKLASISQTDWEGKIGGLSVIDSTGIVVSRSLIPDLSAHIGFAWSITFEKQPGSVHEMLCSTVSGDATCSVSTEQQSSMIDGTFALSTTWPHEYEAEVPGLHTSSSLSSNIDAITLKEELESITDGGIDNSRVFGTVNVVRVPYVPSSQLRWSGGYTWTITFASRGGNIPALGTDGGINLAGSNVQLEVSDEDSGDADTYQGTFNSASFSMDDPGTARDGNQVSGSFALSWDGNLRHLVVSPSANVFAIQTGGSDANQFTALSAADMQSLLTQHIFRGTPDQIHVVRSPTPTQWMSFAYTVVFRHQDVGGDVAPLTYVPSASSLIGQGAAATVTESVRGTSIRGTFQLRFNGETTRPINHDASAEDMEDALNQLTSIAPSAVIVSRTAEPIRTGPADGNGGSSTQVGGYVWTVTFASNAWKDPTEPHDLSDVPGNWFGPSAAAAATLDDVWESSGFPKAWGKNVGDVPMMECIDSGLFTTNGEFHNGCAVAELVRGTNPIGGGFKLCLDSTGANSNGVMSVETDVCTEMIGHNAPASAIESGGDGSSVEEKLEQLDNVGDVTVARSAVNTRNGGYSWTIEFLRDADGPCQQKDDFSESCNAPGNVPKLCSTDADADGGSSSFSCDISGLSGSCERPGDCSKLVVLDATDNTNSIRPIGSAERQLIRVKDPNYLGWADGSIVAMSDTVAEYKLSVNDIETDCIQHNANAIDLAAKIQAALDADTSGSGGGLVKVERIRSEVDAPNGFLYYVSIYDAGNMPPITASFASGTCGANNFGVGQQVIVEGVSDGALHSTTCSGCIDGVVQRGDFTAFGDSDGGVATLPWDASPEEIASHILATSGRTVDVTRRILDKYGAVEWELTFIGNPGETPPGAGDVPLLHVVQEADAGGTSNAPIVSEIQKGSSSLSGSFLMDYFSSSGPRQIAYDESASRLAAKLSDMSTIGTVHVTRDCFPDCSSGGWGNVAVGGTTATRGGLEWKIYFLDNPGIYDGFTFPPGSGSIDSPSIDTGALGGTSVLVESDSVVEGSLPLTGTFHLEIDGEQTAPIPYAADATTIEQSLFDLSNTGRISVQIRDAATKAIPNVLVSVDQDASVLRVQPGSDDLRTHLAPGDRFRVGGGSDDGIGEPDGAVEIGSARLTANSPIMHLSSSSSSSTSMPTSTISHSQLNVGEHVRVRGDVYGIVRHSVEVQSIAVARAEGLATDDYFYQIEAAMGDATETTSSCLKFDASAFDVQQALEELSFFQEGGVIISRSESTTGTLGDAHLYRIYFVGESLLSLGNLPEIVVTNCVLGLPAGVDSTNSHATVRTIVDGGDIEHQRITLTTDAGATATVPAYQITIHDDDFSSSVTSPCIEWGASSLALANILGGAFSRPVFTVGAGGIATFDDGNGTPNLYQVEASSFVQGTILMGDMVKVGDSCRGQVVGFVEGLGESFHIQAPQGCSAAIGEVIAVEKDASIIESSSSSLTSFVGGSSSNPTTEITELTMYSDSAVVATDGDVGLFKLRLTHQGLGETTSCIQYGATAEEIQTELDGLFDYNLDGVIDEGDDGHIVVTRQGDGTIESGFGFTYRLESKGSPNSGNGVSTVLGSGAPTIEIAAGGLIGDIGGCSDTGGHEALVSTQVTVTAGSDTVSSLDYLAGHIQSRSRIKLDASSSTTKTYTVQEVSENGMTLMLDEPFVGTSTSGTASISVLDGGVPHVDISVLRPGVDEYVYDIYFTGFGWSDVPDMEVSVFGDGTCEADITNVQGGMNRNIAATTVRNGGNGSDNLTRRDVVLDRAIAQQDEVVETPVYLVPPIYTVHDDIFEVQQLIVKDTDNGAIWGGDAAVADSSFKLIYDGGEATECLSYQSTESQVEVALSALPGLCSFGEDSSHDSNNCVTVTRAVDAVQAPNGFAFTIYFNGDALSSRGDVPELIVDTVHPDCMPFTAAGGESAEVKTIRNGSTSTAFTSSQLPLGHRVYPRSEMSTSTSTSLSQSLGGDSSRWYGSSAQNLSLYRVTGTLWTATFDEYLGDVPPMEISMGSLPESAEARVFDDILAGVNPTSIALSPLTTGVTHYARVTATTEVGDSSSSSSDKATPSDVPPPLANLFVGHALQVNEVQSITLAATHIPEVQRITTSASPMPEVQEIVLSSGNSAIDGGAFGLRIPEKQMIHVLSSSPIEAGSYVLTLEYVDTTASIALGGGQIVAQTMTTACIPWSASAETVQAALEMEASTMNPLGPGSVRVIRSGDASYSSSFGYSYEVEFVGTAYRGNVAELTSDTSSCEALDSPTNDARVQITTNNDAQAVGTDTPRAQLLIESSGGLDIIEGSYQLSVDYLGGVQTTECIDWDASAQEIEAALESLDNIDSVRVGFVESEDNDAAGNADDNASGAPGAPPPFDFQRQFTIYFDGHGMHTDGSNSFAGFDPTHHDSFGVILADSSGGGASSCNSFKAYKDNVLTDFASIDGAEAAVSIESTHRGGSSTLSALASDLTVQDVASSLLDAMPMHFHSILVAQSLEDDESGVTYTLTFGEDNGNVAGLVCNGDEDLTLLGTATCTAQTIMDGNALSGYFFVDSSEPIEYDASVAQMEAAIEGINGIDDVSVTRSGPDGQEGYAWDITFLSHSDGGGDVDELAVYSSLQGKDAAVHVEEIVKGNEIGGTFTLSYGDNGNEAATTTTDPIPFDATADTIKDFIENSSLGVGQVEITGDSLVDTEGGRSFRITFVDSNGDSTTGVISGGGDRPLLQADSSRLSGVGALVTPREEIKGSSARGDSLVISYEMPDHSNGLPITGTAIEADLHEEFIGDTSEIQRPADYSVQIVSIQNDAVALSGSFRLSYDNEVTDDIPVDASDLQIKVALEQLSSVNTVGVVQSEGGWTITFHSVEGSVVKPLLRGDGGSGGGNGHSNKLYPSNASIQIRFPDCSKCLYMTNLLSWKEYNIRARVTNERGPSNWSQTTGTAMTVPSAPTDTRLDVVSGECLELFFSAPLDSGMVSSYLIQHDLVQEFPSPLGSISVSCDVPSCQQLICGLDAGTQYYVRVAAVNEVQVQGNRRWSIPLAANPVDIAPSRPQGLAVSSLVRHGLQLIIDPPVRDGGSEIETFMVSWYLEAAQAGSIEVSLSEVDTLPDGRYIVNVVDASLLPDQLYKLSVQAKNSIGIGQPIISTPVATSGPPDQPSNGFLSTPSHSPLPITEATVTWDAPSDATSSPSVTGYKVEWYCTTCKTPEVQLIKLQRSAPLTNTKFSLSYSPTPEIKKETAMLPWDSPADLVRRELINLGWSETDDLNLLQDVQVSRSTLTNGYAWHVTFGNHPDRDTNDGDIVALVGSVSANGDAGSPTLTVTTSQDGRRTMGQSEVQYLQVVVGSGSVSSDDDVGGFYRLKFEGSAYTPYIAAHADASELELALEQLSMVGDVIVVQNDDVSEESITGTNDASGTNLVHHYEITFASNVGNVDRLLVDDAYLTTRATTTSEELAPTPSQVSVRVFDGDNSLNAFNVRDSAAVPGEEPGLYGSFEELDASARSFTISNLIPGKEYAVAVSTKNEKHGYGPRMIPSPSFMIPPIQIPGKPSDVTLDVNNGYSDSVKVSFSPPTSDGGDDILRYRVELDPSPSYDNPIVEEFTCPNNNKRTVWRVETTAAGGGVISGGSFTLNVQVNGYNYLTSHIPYDAPALKHNETGIADELPAIFSTTSGSAIVLTVPATDVEAKIFEGDRLRFSGQSAPFKYYQVQSVATNIVTLTEPFVGGDGLQEATSRHYGGRGDPSSSRIHCQVDTGLCPEESEKQSGSMQSKLQDLTHAITAGVLVDRDGPSQSNAFVWRITFMDDALPPGSDYDITLATAALTTAGDVGSASVSARLLTRGETYEACHGTLTVPSLGGLVKGLTYHARVLAVNSEGYSLPAIASEPQAPMIIPGPPTSVSLDVASDTELIVMFAPPSDNGGAGITKYMVEWSPSSDFSNVESSSVEYLVGGAPFYKTIEGLSPGMNYYVRASAVNEMGQGLWQSSTPPSLNPHRTPDPPRSIVLASTSETMVTVGWSPPTSDGGDPITKYRVEWDEREDFISYAMPPNKGYRDIDASNESFTIELLNKRKTYFVRVGAINSAGMGMSRIANPSNVIPANQVPGQPYAPTATSGSLVGSIHISWLHPVVPHHSTPCSGTEDGPAPCPTPYGSSLSAANGGSAIQEYEVEVNQEEGFHHGSIRKTTSQLSTTVDGLIPGRIYLVRVLGRNKVGSGAYSPTVFAMATEQ